MKLLVLAAFTLFVVLGTEAGDVVLDVVTEQAQVATTFINDSNIITIPEDTAPEAVPSEDGGGESGEEETTPLPESGETITLGGGSTDDSKDTITEVTVTTTTSTDTSSDSTNGGDSGSESGEDSSTEGSETVSAESILNTLTGSQAVTSTSEQAQSGASTGSSGGGGTAVSGSGAREALLSRNITSITLPPIPEAGTEAAARRAPYTRNDLALVVSAALVQNPDVDDVFFTTNALKITYTSRGRLLFVVPLSYPTKLSLSFDETTVHQRVDVDFPWYKFLMWTGVSKKSLRDTIDPIITNTPRGLEYDRATHIFSAVSDVLVSARGTVQDSVRTVQ